jgi:hypothetical protein
MAVRLRSGTLLLPTTGLTWTFTTINVLAFVWSTLLAVIILGIDLVFVCCYAVVTVVVNLGIDFMFG